MLDFTFQNPPGYFRQRQNRHVADEIREGTGVMITCGSEKSAENTEPR